MRRERGERGGVGDRKVVSLKRSDKKAERKLYILVGCRIVGVPCLRLN